MSMLYLCFKFVILLFSDGKDTRGIRSTCLELNYNMNLLSIQTMYYYSYTNIYFAI